MTLSHETSSFVIVSSILHAHEITNIEEVAYLHLTDEIDVEIRANFVGTPM